MGRLTPALLALLLVVAPISGQDVQKFGVNLYNAIAATAGADDDIAISPYSAVAALSMVYAGAGGSTKSEVGAALGVRSSSAGVSGFAAKSKSINTASSSYTLQSANGVFLEKTFPIEAAFRQVVTGDFGANISSVDYIHNAEAARQQINTFVENNTNKKIKDLFEAGALTSDTRLVLVNAVYFKADWAKAFKATDTADQTFTLSSGTTKSVPLMTQESKFAYQESAELSGAQILELAYKGDATSMIVILPKEETGLKALERSLTPAKLESALQGLRQTEKQTVTVFLPRFKVNAKYELTEQLKSLGINAAFTRGADFSGISRKQNLEISKVVQKVFVEVNEKGTEAAAATGIEVAAFSMPPPPEVFRADRPFLYLIRHKETNAFLFLGRVSDPAKLD